MRGDAREVKDASGVYLAQDDVPDAPMGYKRTELGIIPQDWEYVAISSVARLESGHTPSKSNPRYWNGTIPWLSLHDTRSLDGDKIFSTEQTITEEGLANSSARLLPAGTVAFSRTATVGKATILGRQMATSQDFANYICGPELANDFLVYLFRSMRRAWQSFMAGSIHNTIYMPVFEALKIALPPLKEQHAIAEVLSDVDGLLAALDKLITKKRAIKQAAMQQLLTGKARLPGFSNEWETKRLGEIGYFLKGSGVNRDEAKTGELACIRYGEIYIHHHDFVRTFNSHISPSVAATATRLKKGDILFAGSGETKEDIGKCVAFVGDEEAYAGGDIVILRPDDVDSLFLGYVLNTVSVNQQKASFGQGDAVVHISASALAQITLPIPKKDEQTAIATLLSDMDAEIGALEAHRDKIRAIKQGMMQQLLTGRVRLVEPEAIA